MEELTWNKNYCLSLAFIFVGILEKLIRLRETKDLTLDRQSQSFYQKEKDSSVWF